MGRKLKDLKDLEVMQLMLDVLGVKRTAELFLWATYWMAINPKLAADPESTLEDVARGRLGWSRMSYFRALKDLRRFRDRLIADGYVTEMTDQELFEELAWINAGLAGSVGPRPVEGMA